MKKTEPEPGRTLNDDEVAALKNTGPNTSPEDLAGTIGANALVDGTTNDEAKARHLGDVYEALGVAWGSDPFPVIERLRRAAAIAGPALALEAGDPIPGATPEVAALAGVIRDAIGLGDIAAEGLAGFILSKGYRPPVVAKAPKESPADRAERVAAERETLSATLARLGSTIAPEAVACFDDRTAKEVAAWSAAILARRAGDDAVEIPAMPQAVRPFFVTRPSAEPVAPKGGTKP